MGLDNQLAKASVRFSVSRFTTMEEINFAIQYIQETVQQQRAESALWQLH